MSISGTFTTVHKLGYFVTVWPKKEAKMSRMKATTSYMKNLHLRNDLYYMIIQLKNRKFQSQNWFTN